jgi:hypothetical protein
LRNPTISCLKHAAGKVKLEGEGSREAQHTAIMKSGFQILEDFLLNEVVKRRLDFLKLEARGFSLCEIVKVLSEEYQTSGETSTTTQ